MVDEGKLASVLGEFARTLITDFPIQGILDRLVERIVDVLPITSAGVSLIWEGQAPRYIAASNPAALLFERLQSEIWEGPCLLAYESGDAVEVPDLATDDRFPQFAPAAVAGGLAGVFTFPLRHGAESLGAVDLYRDHTGDLGADDLAAAQTLADVAAAYLLNARAREQALEAADHFRHNALHDALTGLANRLLLGERLDHVARRSQRSGTTAAVLFLDLDRFKWINDAHGHHVGDELLVAVAHRLSGLVRPGDTLARVSGDEFIFLCEDLHGVQDVEAIAARIHDAFTERFVVAGIEVSLTASVGVAFAGPGEEVSQELVTKADLAMYQAKRSGGAGHEIIDLRSALEADNRNGLEIDLRSAITRDELDLVYQPIVQASDGRVVGVEALLRWTHPDRGPIPAMALVEIAEVNGLIDGIGLWVLERSCLDHARWLDEQPERSLDLAVNISAQQLMNPDFVPALTSVLDRTGMDPTALILEVTESVFIDHGGRAMTVLAGLNDLGIRLALDDFGTGYSSLSHLGRLPVRIVKIDQSFVADIGRSPTGVAVLAAVTNLARLLGLTVTAEGVETEHQHEAVRAVGCDYAQGYFYAEPMPASAVGAQLGAQLAPSPAADAAP